MKTWNLGNTTVRNPERIKDALRVLKQFEGQRFTSETQEKFFDALVGAGVVEGSPGREGRAWSGRKWGTAFNQMGLARCWTSRPPIVVSAAGEALLGEDFLDSDVFLRQILKIQLPSFTESNLENAAIHPFYLVLKVSLLLARQAMQGLTKEELALFLQSAYRDDQAEHIVRDILAYRIGREQQEGRVGKRRYFREKLNAKVKELYGEITNQKLSTLQDYADTTVRYSVITGLFAVGRQSLKLKEDQLALAEGIVSKGDPLLVPADEFEDYFYNPSLPELPTDDSGFLRTDIQTLTNSLAVLSQETAVPASLPASPTDGVSLLHLKKQRADLEAQLISLKEIKFYHQQHEAEQVQDIMNVFESIKNKEIIGGSDYYPAWAEWGVWRVFLSINSIASPISETRGFRIDTELYPVHHAKGNAADLLFKYDDNSLIAAEITLNDGERQYAAEREPVQTHILRLVEQNPETPVIGVFVAPIIQPRTTHAFMGTEYSKKLNKAVNLSIVPLTIEQLCQLLPGKRLGCRNYDELHSRLEDILALKEKAQDGNQWLKTIETYFSTG